MSSFCIKAKHKESQEIHDIWCMDDYFGKHHYGYIANIPNAKYMREKEFRKIYEPSEEV